MFNQLGNGDPARPMKATAKSMIDSRSVARDRMDVRDSITGLVGKGYTSLSDDDARGQFARLAGQLGVPTARKLMNKIFIYNQTNQNQGQPLDKKIMGFYETNYDDDEIKTIVETSKMVGSGPIAAMRDSPDMMNASLVGKNMGGNSLVGNTEQAAMIMGQVSKMR
jgi:hypothetical protein